MAVLQRFGGVLERDGGALKWSVVRVPFDAAEIWPKRNGMRVKGRLRAAGCRKGDAEVDFRSSLFPHPKGGQLLLVNKQMQKALGISLGAMVHVEVEPDMEERGAAVPPELEKLLKKDKAMRRFYEELSPSSRRDIDKTINEPKSGEVRVRRAEQLAERMLLAMEGELEPPPILQVAFRKHPKARAGWEAMTVAQRRGHLLGIFYYQGPEAREKRAAKAVEEALKVGKGLK